MARRPANPLSDQFQRLEEQRAQVMRELEAAEKALRQKPKPARPEAVPGGRKIRLNNNVEAIALPRPKEHRFLGAGPSSRSRRTSRRTKTAARLEQIKFLLLCLLLATLVLIVWRNFPG